MHRDLTWLRSAVHAAALVATLTPPPTARAQAAGEERGLFADASVGSPSLDTNQMALEGSGSLGFTSPTVALRASAGYHSFDLAQDDREQTESRFRGAGAGHYLIPLSKLVVLSATGEFAFAQFSNDATFFAPFASTEEVSQVFRALCGAGLRLNPDDTFAARIEVTAGGQREAYLRTAVDGTGTLGEEVRTSTTFVYDVRQRSRWEAAPDTVLLDAQLGLQGHNLSRSRALFSYTPGLGFAQQSDVAAAHRIDGIARLEIVLLAGQVLGLAPYAYGQARYVRTSAAGSAFAVVVPSAGLGIRTPLAL